MKKFIGIAALAASCLAVATPAAAQVGGTRYAQHGGQDEEGRFEAAQRRFDAEYDAFQAALQRYRNSRLSRPGYDGRGNDPRYQQNSYDNEDYDPARDYRAGNYQERVLASDDNVYRGNDGRYYCRRSDGTTGLIVGAAAGGLFGNVIAGRRSSTVGTILGAIAGGAAGSAIDRNQQVRCR